MWEQHDDVSPLIRTRWRARVDAVGTYTVTGSEYWGISFIRRRDGTVAAELDGPRLAAHEVEGTLGETYWGIELAPHVAIADAPKSAIFGATVALPVRSGRVRLGDRDWPLPEWAELEAWVETLVAEGRLRVDEEIRDALQGDRVGASTRTWQRRYRRTVGLTGSQIDQLHRAQHAYVLLQQGARPAEAAAAAGFSDQAHLTRAMRLIRGQTPAAVIAAHGRRDVSLSFKTAQS